MSVYFKTGKGWRFDFTRNGERHTAAWFKTKAEAREAEVDKRKELRKTTSELAQETPVTPTDTGFLELVNRRLDYVQAYNSERYYTDYRYSARRWIERWGHLSCGDVAADDVQDFVLERKRVSAITANKEIRLLRATFNFAIKRGWTEANPTRTIGFLPVEKRTKYVPPPADIQAVINAAEPEEQDYLWAIHETMARVGEINRLTWSDVDLQQRFVILYTRKKKGGHRTPRKVPMTGRLYEILSRRSAERDPNKPWVFWRTCWSRKKGCMVSGPYQYRKALMRKLCKKAGVRHFSFHALRHAAASVLDHCNVPIGTIQRILGHENRTTTEIYLHSIGESERQAMEIFERASLTAPSRAVEPAPKPSRNKKVSHKSHTAADRFPIGIPASC